MAGPYASGGQPVSSYQLEGGTRRGMTAWRVGLNDNGFGQFPNLNGIYRAVSRTDGPRVLVKVWGEQASGKRYPDEGVDSHNPVWRAFAASKNDLMRWLLWPGRVGFTRSPGRAPGFLSPTRGDSGAALFAAENGAYDFSVVYGVAFEPLPFAAEGAGHHHPDGGY